MISNHTPQIFLLRSSVTQKDRYEPSRTEKNHFRPQKTKQDQETLLLTFWHANLVEK
jgi:hypothetical protein